MLCVDIPYDQEADILEASYGTCNLTDSGISLGAKSGNNFTVTLHSKECNMHNRHHADLVYNHTATFIVGREDDGVRLVLATFTVDGTCSYKQSYDVSYNYGALGANKYNFTGESLGGAIELDFAIQAFDSSYSAPLDDLPNRGGEQIYLGRLF